MGDKPLTPKQERFVAEYLVGLNATQAAIRAGYASANADVTGPRLLGNVGIAAAIAAGLTRIAGKLEITAEKVLRDIEAVRVKATEEGVYASAIRASELQGKAIGMFEDKLNVRLRNNPADLSDAELASIIAGEGRSRDPAPPNNKAGLH